MYSCSCMCKDVFKRHKSSGRKLCILGQWLCPYFGQNVSIRVKTLSNTNLVVSSHVSKGKNASFLINVRRSRTPFA